jgi:hypothetical protein
MADDQEKPVVATPEIITPEAFPIIKPEENEKRRRKITIVASAGFLLGLCLWGLNQYLSLRGVVNVLASRIILAFMWPIGTLLIAVLLWPVQMRRGAKKACICILSLLLAGSLLALERWTLKQAEQSPPTKEELLTVNVTANLGTPPDGYAGSIKWKPEYAYIRFRFDDPGPTDFDNLDLTVTFDLAIVDMDQLTKLSGVSMFPDLPVHMMGGSVTAITKDGKKTTIPAYTGAVTSSSAYRIRCEHLPRRSGVDFVVAAVTLNIPQGYSIHEPDTEYGPKRLPTTMTISGSYKVGPKIINVATGLKLVPQQ